MTMTETVRTNLKLDRRWVSCANAAMCATMASVPTDAVVQAAHDRNTDLDADRAWIAEQLTHISGPPGMELRMLDEDEIESPTDYYAILLRIPLPDSNDPSRVFPVGRLGFTLAGYLRDVGVLKRAVHRLFEALALHEVREWLRYDGEHVVDPHPEN